MNEFQPTEMSIFRILPLLFLTFLFQNSFAQKYSNEFMTIGVGARAQGLGNAVVASVNDVTAGYWNPAGLAQLPAEKGLQLGAMHAEWFAGIGKFDYLAATIPLAKANRRIGLSLIRFGIDDIPNTLSLFEDDGTINYDNVVSFSAADYGILLSYAQPLKVKSGKFFVGGNVKIIRRLIGDFAHSWGFGLDLGAQYHRSNWRFGLTARDITTTFNAWETSFSQDEQEILLETGNELPKINSVETTNPQILLGVAYQFQWSKVGLIPELDFVLTTDGERNTLVSSDPISIDPAFGLELDYNHFVFLRAGINQFQKELDLDGSELWISRPSIGVGLQIGGLRVDYAFTDPGDSRNTYSHIISLVYDMKGRKKGD